MKIMIKVNPREPESLRRFYVTANDRLIKAHLTFSEAELLKARLKMKHCKHNNNETIEISGTDETISICHDCGYEI